MIVLCTLHPPCSGICGRRPQSAESQKPLSTFQTNAREPRIWSRRPIQWKASIMEPPGIVDDSQDSKRSSKPRTRAVVGFAVDRTGGPGSAPIGEAADALLVERMAFTRSVVSASVVRQKYRFHSRNFTNGFVCAWALLLRQLFSSLRCERSGRGSSRAIGTINSVRIVENVRPLITAGYPSAAGGSGSPVPIASGSTQDGRNEVIRHRSPDGFTAGDHRVEDA